MKIKLQNKLKLTFNQDEIYEFKDLILEITKPTIGFNYKIKSNLLDKLKEIADSIED
jgi:hypothetical protein